MRRAAWVLACVVAVVVGCKHESPTERMQKLLYQSDGPGRASDWGHGRKISEPPPVPEPLPPERIHGGII